VAFSQDCRRIATGDGGGQVIIWGTRVGAVKRSFSIGRNRPVIAIAFSPDGLRIACSALDDGVGKRPQTTVTGAPGWIVQVWDVKDAEISRVLQNLRSNPVDVAFSPDGKRLTCGARKDLHCFNVDAGMKLKRYTHTVLRNFKHPQVVTAAAWSPDGKQIATGAKDGGLRVWDADSGVLVWCVWGHTGKNGCLCPSRRRGGPPNPGCPLLGHRDHICKVFWSDSGATVGTVSEDGSCKLWSAATGDHLRTSILPVDPKETCFALGPDPHTARRLAVAMGFNDRLGAASCFRWLDPAVARMLLEV